MLSYTKGNYMLFKGCLYYMLVQRLSQIFSNDNGIAIGWNGKFLRIWTVIIILWSLINIIAVCLVTDSVCDDSQIPKCKSLIKPWNFLMYISMDIIVGSINIILFTKPLIYLYQTRNNDKFKTVAIKQCILSFIAISSSVIALVCVATFNIYVFVINADVIISILCIILMYHWNAYITDKLLCCCIKCCGNLIKAKEDETRENIEFDIVEVTADETEGNKEWTQPSTDPDDVTLDLQTEKSTV